MIPFPRSNSLLQQVKIIDGAALPASEIQRCAVSICRDRMALHQDRSTLTTHA